MSLPGFLFAFDLLRLWSACEYLPMEVHAGIDFMSLAVHEMKPVQCLVWEVINMCATENSSTSRECELT
jgi:hypothetical protein